MQTGPLPLLLQHGKNCSIIKDVVFSRVFNLGPLPPLCMNTYPYELTDKGLFSCTHCHEWVKWVSYVRVISCTRVRYCRGKMLKTISLHVLELKNKEEGGVCVCVKV